ncbi:MAG: biopolymer transporter ExbD [Deltaproteobacteria bacterium]|jgi:biopolymer transport protein ExbD|nr:biopolymer transporter ExbD [Deltaproteobacteria bacterium]
MKVADRHLGIKKPRIEMLPLIDIVFLLLVFFIYAMLSMVVHRSLPVTLPVSATAEIDTEMSLAITVRPNGEIYLDEMKVSREEMSRLLQERVQKDNSLQVELFADETVSYQELYRILDIIRTAGIANVSLQADSPQ